VPVDIDLDGSEALVLAVSAAELSGQGRRVALDHQVDVGPRTPEQQVPHRTADQVNRLPRYLANGLQLGVSLLKRPREIVHRSAYHDGFRG
jgi:hypothetical protein